MKTERVVLLTTPEFKKFLTREASKEGVSVAELVRSRCEERPRADEVELMQLSAELRTAVARARSALNSGLSEAQAALSELRHSRDSHRSSGKTATAKSRA